jgi:hypothetical protein
VYYTGGETACDLILVQKCVIVFRLRFELRALYSIVGSKCFLSYSQHNSFSLRENIFILCYAKSLLKT